MTTLATPPVVNDRPSPGDEGRHVLVFANLLPDEVVSARQNGHSRRIVVFALVGVLIVLAIGYGLSALQTSVARSDLRKAQAQQLDLMNQQNSYSKLQKTQDQTAQLNQDLATLMAGDLQWATLTRSVRAAAPSGVSVVSINATLQTSSATSTSSVSANTALLPAGVNVIGSMTLSVSAQSISQISQYLLNLDKVHGLVDAAPAGYSSATKSLNATVNVYVTSDALGGRYSSKKGN